MTSPFEPLEPRTRSGLSKLRGDSAGAVGPVAPAPVERQEPAGLAQESGVGTLTKEDIAPPGAPQSPVEPTAAGASRGVLVTVVALILAIVALLVVVLMNPFDSAAKSSPAGAGTASGGTPDQRLTVVRAARQFTVSFFTYDYRQIDAYFRRIEAASSGSFRQDFVSKEATLKTVVTQLKTVATGQVPDTGAGLVSYNGNNATALLAANFNASNAVTRNGQKRYRVKVVLQRVKGVWLVTNFDQVV